MKDASKLALKRLPPKSHLEAIGAIAAQWAVIEVTIEMIVLGLYELHMDRGLVFTSLLTLNAKVDLLRILANNEAVDDKALSERLMAVANRVPEVYGERNKVVHGQWVRTDQPGVARRLTLRARGKTVTGAADGFTSETLWAVFDRVVDLLLELTRLADALGVESKLEKAPRHSKTARA